MNDKLLGMLGLCVRAGKAVFGAFSTEKAIMDGSIKCVVASADIGESNKRSIEYKCKSNNIPLIFYSDKDTLSRAVGKKGIPVVGICDDNFSSAIIKIYGGVAK